MVGRFRKEGRKGVTHLCKERRRERVSHTYVRRERVSHIYVRRGGEKGCHTYM